MSSIVAKRANKRVCPLQPNGMLSRGTHAYPGANGGSSTPMEVYQVLAASEMQSRFEVAVGTGLTPFVGREEERGLLQRRWAQTKAGAGQVVLLSGEPGIGKSRLVQTLQEHASADGAIHIAFHCSAYHHNSA